METQNKTNEKRTLKLFVFRDNNGRVCLKENNFNFDSNKLIGFKDLTAEDLINESKPNGFYCENCFKEDLKQYIETQNGTILCCEKCLKEYEEELKKECDLNFKRCVGK